jgi:acyl-coenzyme A synthetase/AMP-(fatty) acid ligase
MAEPENDSILKYLCKKNEHTLNWEFVFSATGPLETLIRDDFRKNMGVEVFNTYGSTEQMFISGETIPDIEVSCGQAFSGVSLAIRSKSQIVSVKSNVVAIGVFSWNTVLESYDFNAQSPDESIETADVGSIKAGRLYLAGRTDSMVVLGGLNVSLSAIENEARIDLGIELIYPMHSESAIAIDNESKNEKLVTVNPQLSLTLEIQIQI